MRGACTSWQNYTDGIVLKSFTEKISSRQVDLGQNFHESVFFNRFQKLGTNKMPFGHFGCMACCDELNTSYFKQRAKRTKETDLSWIRTLIDLKHKTNGLPKLKTTIKTKMK